MTSKRYLWDAPTSQGGVSSCRRCSTALSWAGGVIDYCIWLAICGAVVYRGQIPSMGRCICSRTILRPKQQPPSGSPSSCRRYHCNRWLQGSLSFHSPAWTYLTTARISCEICFFARPPGCLPACLLARKFCSSAWLHTCSTPLGCHLQEHLLDQLAGLWSKLGDFAEQRCLRDFAARKQQRGCTAGNHRLGEPADVSALGSPAVHSLAGLCVPEGFLCWWPSLLCARLHTRYQWGSVRACTLPLQPFQRIALQSR